MRVQEFADAVGRVDPHSASPCRTQSGQGPMDAPHCGPALGAGQTPVPAPAICPATAQGCHPAAVPRRPPRSGNPPIPGGNPPARCAIAKNDATVDLRVPEAGSWPFPARLPSPPRLIPKPPLPMSFARSLQTQHILHVIKTRRLPHRPFRRPQGPFRKRLPARSPMA